MSDDKAENKVLKKQFKSEAKEAKKSAKAQAAAAEPTASNSSASSLTPAERSAAAAERQVKLQSMRVVIALAAMGVALATLLITIKPWENWRTPSAQPSTPTDVTTSGV